MARRSGKQLVMLFEGGIAAVAIVLISLCHWLGIELWTRILPSPSAVGPSILRGILATANYAGGVQGDTDNYDQADDDSQKNENAFGGAFFLLGHVVDVSLVGEVKGESADQLNSGCPGSRMPW